MKINILIFFISFSISGQTTSFNHSLFNNLLSKSVNEDGDVDYLYYKGNEKFEAYLEKIAEADISKFSKEEKLAFYINSYNAFVIKNVNNWQINSPMDVEGFFKKYKFKIAGEILSLDEIEYERVLKIEPVFSHFGLVCAAKSCPKILPFVYTSENVYQQLEVNMKLYLRDTSKNCLDKKEKTLYLSQIFNWFKESFEKNYGSLKNLAVKYMADSDAGFIRKNEIKINFLEYNWGLNSQ